MANDLSSDEFNFAKTSARLEFSSDRRASTPGPVVALSRSAVPFLARLLSLSHSELTLPPANVELWSGVRRHLPCAFHRHLTVDAFLPCTRCPESVGLTTVPPSRAMLTLLWPIGRGEQRSLDMPPPFLLKLVLG